MATIKRYNYFLQKANRKKWDELGTKKFPEWFIKFLMNYNEHDDQPTEQFILASLWIYSGYLHLRYIFGKSGILRKRSGREPEINHIIALVRDVTGQREAEQKLRNSNVRLREFISAKEKFYAIIAHDFCMA